MFWKPVGPHQYPFDEPILTAVEGISKARKAGDKREFWTQRQSYLRVQAIMKAHPEACSHIENFLIDRGWLCLGEGVPSSRRVAETVSDEEDEPTGPVVRRQGTIPF